MKRIFFLANILVLTTAALCNAGGHTARHSGGQNPIAEGWSLIDESTGDHRFGPVQTPIPPMPLRGSWRIDTESNGGSGVGAYQKNFPQMEVPIHLRVTLRTLDIETLGGQSIHLATGVPLPGGDFLHLKMRFGVSDDGDPLVALGETGLPIEIQGGANLFHTYSFWVDPRPPYLASTFAINGVYQGPAEIYGDPSSDALLEWGDLNPDPAINGSALWYFIRLRGGVPEPSSFMLAVLGFAGLASRRRIRE